MRRALLVIPVLAGLATAGLTGCNSGNGAGTQDVASQAQDVRNGGAHDVSLCQQIRGSVGSWVGLAQDADKGVRPYSDLLEPLNRTQTLIEGLDPATDSHLQTAIERLGNDIGSARTDITNGETPTGFESSGTDFDARCSAIGG